jgi:hypothetical protein
MPEIYHVQRNSRKYAYRSTSRYEPGKKYPVTVNEYLGRVDEGTGNIIPKKSRAVGTSLIDEAALRSRRFGGSYALVGLAESIGLRDDLYDAFGTDGDRLLAAAVAQALAGGPLSSVEDAADGCLVRELLGIGGRFSSPRLTELTQRLGEAHDDMEALFEKRLARTRDVLSYDITSISTYGHMRGWAEWGHNRDEEALRQANVALITDREGVPAMFEIPGLGLRPRYAGTDGGAGAGAGRRHLHTGHGPRLRVRGQSPAHDRLGDALRHPREAGHEMRQGPDVVPH